MVKNRKWVVMGYKVWHIRILGTHINKISVFKSKAWNCKRSVRNPQLSSHGPCEKQLQSKCCQLFSSKRNSVALSRIPRRGKNAAFIPSKIQARCKAKPSNGWIILTKHDTTVFFFKEQRVVLCTSSKIFSAFKVPNFFTPSLEEQLQSKRRNQTTPRTFMYSQEKREIAFCSSKIRQLLALQAHRCHAPANHVMRDTLADRAHRGALVERPRWRPRVRIPVEVSIGSMGWNRWFNVFVWHIMSDICWILTERYFVTTSAPSI